MRIVNLLRTTKTWLTFLTVFVNTGFNLKLSYNKSLPQNRDILETAEQTIKNFENNGSIAAIRTREIQKKPVTKEMIAKEISDLKPRKAVCSNDIPTKILKDFQDLFAKFIYNNCNKSFLDGTFPENL